MKIDFFKVFSIIVAIATLIFVPFLLAVLLLLIYALVYILVNETITNKQENENKKWK